MKRRFRALLIAVLALASIPAAAQDKIKVVASFSILGDMVRQVTGDLAEVTTIVGPDADAHVYTPNAADAKAVTNAEVIFVNGLGFETWSQTLIETSGSKAKVFVATDGITPLKVDGEIDPHAWNSLTNGMKYVANIADSMAEADPKNAEAYKANARAYTARLKALHNRALDQLRRLPADRRTVVTAHDAFGYLEAAYGLTFLAPVGRLVAHIIDAHFHGTHFTGVSQAPELPINRCNAQRRHYGGRQAEDFQRAKWAGGVVNNPHDGAALVGESVAHGDASFGRWMPDRFDGLQSPGSQSALFFSRITIVG